MADRKSRGAVAAVAAVLVAILIGGAIVLATGVGETVATVQADDESAFTGSDPDLQEAVSGEGLPEPGGGESSESSGEVSGVSSDEDPNEITDNPSDEATGESSESSGSSVSVDAEVAVSYACPEGSEGTASASGSTCVTVASQATAANETATYRCPSGSTGAPTQSDPTCEQIDESASVVLGASYECPAGGEGDPSASNPTCVAITRSKIPPILDQNATEYGCPQGATEQVVGGQLTCTRSVPGVETIPAEKVLVHTCPAPLYGQASEQNPYCTQRSYAEAQKVEVTTYECERYWTLGTSGPGNGFCVQGVQSVSGSNGWECPPGSFGTATGPRTGCQISEVPTAVTTLECPAGFVDHPSSVDPPCISTTFDETTVDATVEITYGCPVGSTPHPTSQQTCGRPGAVDEMVEPIVVRRVLMCPAGSAGDPSPPNPTCVAETSSTVPATKTETYGCPAGYHASGAVAADDYCLRTERVPAEIVDVDYSCPSGSTGTPSSADPTCRWTTSEPVDPITTTNYSCPAGSSGQPSASYPYCERTTAS